MPYLNRKKFVNWNLPVTSKQVRVYDSNYAMSAGPSAKRPRWRLNRLKLTSLRKRPTDCSIKMHDVSKWLT